MNFFNITEPVTLILLLAATVLLIFLGKEIKRPFVPAIALVFFLILVIVHSVQLANLPENVIDEYKSIIMTCISVDLIMVLITFFAYLWIDDLSSKFYKKKNIDNSLDWFWNKV